MDASALASAESWLSAIAIAKLVAAFLVAAGVVIEFGGDWVARPFEATVKHAREVQVAALEKDAEIAKSEIAKANAEAARANERTAEIEKITAWRRLEPENAVALAAALKDVPSSVLHSVAFAYPPNDMESLYFTAQIAGVFIDLKGWNVERQSRTYAGILYWGVHIIGRETPTLTAIRNAFTESKIDFSTEDFKSGFQTYGYILQPDDAVILVGPKKPPFEP